MRTALEIYNEVVMELNGESPNSVASFTQICVDAINRGRKETIEECAEKAKIKRQNPYEYATALAGGSECMVDKQSILSLITLVK